MKFFHYLCFVFAFSFSVVVGATDKSETKETAPAKRIIALAPHIVENLYTIGAGDLIIGTTEHADFPEAAKEIPRVGNYARLNIEQILASDPDLIIAWKSGSPSDDIERLKSFGIPIVESKPTTLEEVAEELIFLGKLTGKNEAAKQVAQTYLSGLQVLRTQYQDKAPISVFYELWPRPLTTIAKQAWPQQQLDLCQVNNAFIDSKTDYPQINVEDVVLASPDIIIQPSAHSNSMPDNINWQQWKTIPAVKNNAFLHPNADKMHRMTIRSLDELTLLCQQIDEIRQRAK